MVVFAHQAIIARGALASEPQYVPSRPDSLAYMNEPTDSDEVREMPRQHAERGPFPLMGDEGADHLYFRQLLSGRDFAINDPVASQMMNFSYLVGDSQTRAAVIVDPAYCVEDPLAVLAADSMTLAGVLATHHHPDHVGGSIFGISIEGVLRLVELQDVPIHVNRDELTWVARSTGIAQSQLVSHDSGDTLSLGAVEIEFLHTPGHTPGSQCFLVRKRLLAGDTLFLQGCGRTDLPGGDPAALYDSLTKRLARVPDDTLLFPGHHYSHDAVASMGATRSENYVLRPAAFEEWMAAFGTS